MRTELDCIPCFVRQTLDSLRRITKDEAIQEKVLRTVLMADAEASGMTSLVKVVDSGSDVPGTILEDCSADFRNRFRGADLVLAKGQGNYETLSGADRHMFFLLRVKCAVVARLIGVPAGSLVLAEHSPGGR